MVMYREVCPEGVQNKCPGGVWCRGFMSWGDTLILVISRGVQLYYGIALNCISMSSCTSTAISFHYACGLVRCCVLNYGRTLNS